jgi:hypothetical protein
MLKPKGLAISITSSAAVKTTTRCGARARERTLRTSLSMACASLARAVASQRSVFFIDDNVIEEIMVAARDAGR